MKFESVTLFFFALIVKSGTAESLRNLGGCSAEGKVAVECDVDGSGGIVAAKGVKETCCDPLVCSNTGDYTCVSAGGTSAPTTSPLPPACPEGDTNCHCLDTANSCTSDSDCASLTCSKGSRSGLSCSTDENCPQGRGFAECIGSITQDSCACAALDEDATDCGAASGAKACCNGLTCDACNSSLGKCVDPASLITDPATDANCEDWCRSDDILGWYQNNGLECGEGFFRYTTSSGEECSNNCYSSTNESVEDCTVHVDRWRIDPDTGDNITYTTSYGICCCDCGVTPYPVQAFGHWTTGGNTNYCKYPTGVHDSCGDCMGISDRYSLTGITGSVSNDICYCSLEYTDGASSLSKVVWDSSCPLNVEAEVTYECYRRTAV